MKRVFQGITLIRRDHGWHTEDGRYTISEDNVATTFCEGPHPMRTGKWTGSYCEGNQEHHVTMWNVWDNETDDHAFGDVYDTMREAVAELARAIKEGTKP